MFAMATASHLRWGHWKREGLKGLRLQRSGLIGRKTGVHTRFYSGLGLRRPKQSGVPFFDLEEFCGEHLLDSEGI